MNNSLLLSLKRLVVLLGVTWILCVTPATAADSSSAEQVLESYLRALYARDSVTAYQMVSSTDKAEKTLADYRSENGSYSDSALLLSAELAKAIQFQNMEITVTGDQATAVFDVALPNANDPSITGVVEGYDNRRLGRLSEVTLQERRLELAHMAQQGQLPFIQSNNEEWQLVYEKGEWKVFENWADAIAVHFSSIVMNELDWEFHPVRTLALVQPGQTVEMAYRAVNTGDVQTTGKARHIIGPVKTAEYLEIIACFCFLEQTLEPGEEVNMPLVFRVDFEVPEEIRTFDVKYEFYPLENFPEDATS